MTPAEHDALADSIAALVAEELLADVSPADSVIVLSAVSGILAGLGEALAEECGQTRAWPQLRTLALKYRDRTLTIHHEERSK